MTGGCAAYHRDSCTSVSPVEEPSLTGLIGLGSLHLGLGHLPSGFDLRNRQLQCRHLNLDG